LNVDVRLWYEINIVAESMGGVSLQSIISGSIDETSGKYINMIIIAIIAIT